MQTQKLLLPVMSCNEFPGVTTKFVATVRAFDLKNVQLPLNANVRKPTRNYVVNSILESIKTKHGVMLIESPIFVACRSARIMAASDKPGKYYLELEFDSIDGVIDGGHRLESIRLAIIDRGQYDTDNVFLSFHVEAGLSKEAIAAKAIALNTSKNPAVYELSNFKGEYDWLKECLQDTEFTHVQYFSGQLSGGFDGDSFCRVSNLMFLLQVLNPSYDPKKLGALPKQRHPMFTSGGSLGGHAMVSLCAANKKRVESNPHFMKDLMVDALRLYCLILKHLDAAVSRSPLPFITTVKDARKASHLPDGSVLIHKHPSRLYIVPMLSCFRLLMEDNFNGWKVNPLDDMPSTEKMIKALITKFRYIMQRGDRSMLGTAIVYKDAYTWDQLYAKAESDIQEGKYFRELQLQIDTAA
jgi:hypothetical protein